MQKELLLIICSRTAQFEMEKYELGDPLGELGKTKSSPNVKVAVKTVLRSHPHFDMKSLNHEISIMRAAKHPKCIELIEVIEDKQAVHLVEELASGGELFDRIVALGRFTEKDAVFLVHQVFDGIAYLHSIDIIHRDLKPENLLMVGRDESDPSYMQIKIADFGLSAMRANSKSDEEWSKEMREFCGTQDYLAPEVFKIGEGHSLEALSLTSLSAALGKKAGNLQYDAKVDVWSIGVIYYIMLCGYPPFYSEDNDMLKMIQQVDTSKRPSAAECLKDVLFANNHVFSDEPLNVKDDLREFLLKRRKRVSEHHLTASTALWPLADFNVKGPRGSQGACSYGDDCQLQIFPGMIVISDGYVLCNPQPSGSERSCTA
eukprot:754308-Hanusia_phi.AAC.5